MELNIFHLIFIVLFLVEIIENLGTFGSDFNCVLNSENKRRQGKSFNGTESKRCEAPW